MGVHVYLLRVIRRVLSFDVSCLWFFIGIVLSSSGFGSSGKNTMKSKKGIRPINPTVLTMIVEVMNEEK